MLVNQMDMNTSQIDSECVNFYIREWCTIVLYNCSCKIYVTVQPNTVEMLAKYAHSGGLLVYEADPDRSPWIQFVHITPCSKADRLADSVGAAETLASGW
jgi:hypothetical protein